MSEDTYSGKCPIWGTPAYVGAAHERKLFVDSPRAGGKYEIHSWLLDKERNVEDMEDERQKARLTTMLIDRRMQGDDIPYIDHNDIVNTKNEKNISIYKRADRLLRYLVTKSKNIGHSLALSIEYDPSNEYRNDFTPYKLFLECLAWSESIKQEEFSFLMTYLANQKFVSIPRFGIAMPGYKASCCVFVEGYSKVEQDILNPDASQAFVAMWFGGKTEEDRRKMDNLYEEGIKKAVESTGYKPIQIGKKEDVNKIDDEIIAEIRRSRFLIADFTQGEDGARGGVYYEAGFAQGLGIPVIYSCREDMIDDDKLHFDTRQYHHVVWKDPDDLDDLSDFRDRLQKRILAFIGEGPLNNPTVS